MYIRIYVSDDALILKSTNTLLLEVSHFLDYVQEKFSEVLLPVDTITKQGLLGKGYKKAPQLLLRIINLT